MVRNVLVPVDLSDRHGPVIERVKQLTEPDGQVTLLHVIEQIQDVPGDEMESFYVQFRERAEKSLERLEGEFAGSGLRLRKKIIVGRRAQEIIDFAQSDGSDLIVLAAHLAHPAQGARTFGTISHQVAILAHCSVLLVR